jgi:hypothetical protein
MRAREFLSEDYEGDLMSELNNLLVVAKGSGADSIRTQDLANSLRQNGYSASPESIEQLLSNNQMNVSVTPEEITFIDNQKNNNDMDSEESAQKVKQMAQRSVERGLEK